MLSYLGSFSASFGLSIAVWPFVSLLLTLPVLALIYHRYHRLRLAAALAAYLVILYLLALVCFTLWPMPDDRAAFCATHHLAPQLNPLRFLSDLSFGGRDALLQIVLNLVFFLPLGFIMGRVFRWRLRLALPAGFLTSLTIETAQLTGAFGLVGCAYRLFDVDDLLWNTSGALIGFACAVLLNRLVPPRSTHANEVVRSPSFLHRCVTMAVDLVLVYSLSSSLGFGLVVVINAWAGHRSNGDYDLAGWAVSTHALRLMVIALDLASLLFFELLIPFLRRGQTLGAAFTHMSVETRARRGWTRAAFYLARTTVLLLVFGPWSGRLRSWVNLLAFLLLVFYVIKRQMPYDLIPVSPVSTAASPLSRPVGGQGSGSAVPRFAWSSDADFGDDNPHEDDREANQVGGRQFLAQGQDGDGHAE
ncbi:VanZ family protein [Bifidobacterium actinocoloniiforme DSM 22766]|uniref:VanZ family protein n=1 Tax=Bifidobacterium actinocoloniiforme DSM 22766 TaxID=1437605 RepID=A0A086Z2P4_9BIFI|nr:VanZ family protein [Bifidobacterium actinocoloniiforme DSM 22766]